VEALFLKGSEILHAGHFVLIKEQNQVVPSPEIIMLCIIVFTVLLVLK